MFVNNYERKNIEILTKNIIFNILFVFVIIENQKNLNLNTLNKNKKYYNIILMTILIHIMKKTEIFKKLKNYSEEPNIKLYDIISEINTQ